MKPLALLILLTLGIFTSCKKTYTCTCTVDVRQQNHQYTSQERVITYDGVTHAQAKGQCKNEDSYYNSQNALNYMHNCKL
jgi:hypothetical protein